jgi:SAM-dependent methyltransferase
MSFSELKNNWNRLGKKDPLWAVLSDPSKKNGRWDPEAFFATGSEEVTRVFSILDRLQRPEKYERVLDFGCGVGRLARHFLNRFSGYSGVDISLSMIRRARRWNSHLDKAVFFLNDRPDLSIFKSDVFDLIYCNLVLQHMEPQYSKKYIEEFVRIVKPEGLIIFQIPAFKRTEIEDLPGCTRIEKNLPDEAFRASLKINGFDGIFREKVCRELSVTVINQSHFLWPALGRKDGTFWIRLGNHWRFPSGELIALEDGRSFLPKDLGPQENLEIPLTVVPPPFAGKYLLEIEMVQEGNVWFSEKGQPPLRLEVEVEGSKDLLRSCLWKTNLYLGPHLKRILRRLRLQRYEQEKSNQDDFEMHGMTQEEVLQILSDNNAEAIEIQTDQNAGGYWTSHTYLVKKTG